MQPIDCSNVLIRLLQYANEADETSTNNEQIWSAVKQNSIAEKDPPFVRSFVCPSVCRAFFQNPRKRLPSVVGSWGTSRYYSYTHTYMHKHKHSCSHMHLHAMHPSVQVKSIRAESRWWTHTRTRTHTNTQMHAHAHAHAHAHTRARTHTHARIHTQTCGLNYGKAAARCQWRATAKRTPTQS